MGCDWGHKNTGYGTGPFKIRVNAICPGTQKVMNVRVIRDKANFLKISKKKIEKEFISMASMNCWIYGDDIEIFAPSLFQRKEKEFWSST